MSENPHAWKWNWTNPEHRRHLRVGAVMENWDCAYLEVKRICEEGVWMGYKDNPAADRFFSWAILEGDQWTTFIEPDEKPRVDRVWDLVARRWSSIPQEDIRYLFRIGAVTVNGEVVKDEEATVEHFEKEVLGGVGVEYWRVESWKGSVPGGSNGDLKGAGPEKGPGADAAG